MARRRGRAAVAALALASALLVAGTGTAQATFPGPNGRIAFTDFASAQIYAVNPDGSALHQLTHAGPHQGAAFPDWSANGRRLVFEKLVFTTARDRIWIMNAEGSHERRVARDGKRFADRQPVFTPDGRHIVFSRCEGSEKDICAIWKMRRNGTHKEALTRFRKANETFDGFASVSPNGRRIAFTRFNNSGIEARIFVMNIDGSHAHSVTRPAIEGGSPDWKPNGRRIVFSSNSFRTGSSVFTMRPDGSDIHRITPDRYPHNDANGVYSPRGNRIVFVSDRNYPDACCNDLFSVGSGGGTGQLIDTGLSNPVTVGPAWGTHPLLP